MKPVHEQLAELLAAGQTAPEAAAVLGKPVRTVHNWSRRDDVLARVAELRHAATSNVVCQLSAIASRAVQTLGLVMRDDLAPPAARVRAALGVLAQLVNLTEFHEIETRLEAIEKQVAENNQR